MPARAAGVASRSVGGGALLLVMLSAAVHAASLAPLAGPEGATPQAPWVFSGLPGQSLPATRFMFDRLEDRTVLRIQTAGSYGNLVHPLAASSAGRLSWRWRVDLPLKSADLRSRPGDDVALKVCALFDMPRESVPFLDRQLLRLAETRTGQPLPTATVCYAWDPSSPADTVVPNAYSRRVRYITLGMPPRTWQAVSRNLADDFIRAFGDETTTVPPLRAIAVGADADNTGGSSIGFIADLEWTPTGTR